MTHDQPTATPRTDAEEFFLPPEAANCIEPPQNDGVVESKYARTLERELSSAQAALAEAKAEVAALKAMLDKCTPLNVEERAYLGTLRDREEISKATNDQLRSEVERLNNVLAINKSDTDHIITSQRTNLVELRARVAELELELAETYAVMYAWQGKAADALKHITIVADSLNSNDPRHKPHKDSIEVVCTALKAKEILSNERQD